LHKIKILTINNKYKTQFKRSKILYLCREVLNGENISDYDISVIFVDEEFITDLNKRFFNKNATTDVISFNLSEEKIEGEIYVNFDIIKDQAEYYSVSFDDELKRVIIHGLLHLAGYKDYKKKERKIIKEKEDLYLKVIERRC